MTDAESKAFQEKYVTAAKMPFKYGSNQAILNPYLDALEISLDLV